MNQLLAKKPLSVLLEEAHGEQRLRRILGPVQLSSLGIGAIIGTGIFVLVGVAAHDRTVNIGTLLAFVIVCAAVLIMRKTHPDAERPFQAPFGPIVPLLGIASCLVLMFSLPAENWLRLAVWLVIGLVIYFSYGLGHSALAQSAAIRPDAMGPSAEGR